MMRAGVLLYKSSINKKKTVEVDHSINNRRYLKRNEYECINKICNVQMQIVFTFDCAASAT